MKPAGIGARGPPYLLEDVHARLELLCLELDAVGGTALPWWELATPDAHEELAVTPACGSNLESASSGALTRARAPCVGAARGD